MSFSNWIGDAGSYVGQKYFENGGDLAATAGDIAQDAGAKITDEATKGFISSCWESFVNGMQNFLTVWMKAGPLIDLNGDAMSWVSDLTAFVTVIGLTFGLIIGGARTLYSLRGENIRVALEGLFRVVLVAAGGGMLVSLLIPAVDAFSQWVVEDLAAADLSGKELPDADAVIGTMGAMTIVTSILGWVLILIQWALLMARGILLPVLVMFWPMSESAQLIQGKPGFSRVTYWIISFLLFKPIVAILYAFSFKLLQGGDGIGGVLGGICVIGMSVFALPAVMKVVMPQATASGTSGGGQELVGAVTTAAAVGAAVATGGGSAAAGGATAGGGEVAAGKTLGETGWTAEAGGEASTATSSAVGGNSTGAEPGPSLAETTGTESGAQESGAGAGGTGTTSGSGEPSTGASFGNGSSEAGAGTDLGQEGWTPTSEAADDSGGVGPEATESGQGPAGAGPNETLKETGWSSSADSNTSAADAVSEPTTLGNNQVPQEDPVEAPSSLGEQQDPLSGESAGPTAGRGRFSSQSAANIFQAVREVSSRAENLGDTALDEEGFNRS